MKTAILSIITLVIALASCQWSPNVDHHSPYPIRDVLVAEVLIRDYQKVPYHELQRLCRPDRVAAACLLNYSEIYVSDDLSPEAEYSAYLHELAHAYEVLMLGVPPEESRDHVGWIRP